MKTQRELFTELLIIAHRNDVAVVRKPRFIVFNYEGFELLKVAIIEDEHITISESEYDQKVKRLEHSIKAVKGKR